MVDAAEHALEFINYVLGESDCKEDFIGCFRSITRELYSMAYFENLASTIAFAYSKAKEEVVISLLEDKKDNIKENDKKDYAYYLVGINKFLKALKEEGYQIDVDIDGSIDSLMKLIRKDRSIENKILNYMKWLKYFAEAKIEKGEIN